ncbi:MAG: hypothetical protein R3C49_14375 [Planctomycetaceae bacterium]
MSETSRGVILLASDLMLTSSVSSLAASAGIGFRSTDSIEAVLQFMAEVPDAALLVDLGCPGLQLSDIAGKLDSRVLSKAVAYGPHVHAAKLQAARDAGFGTVLSRGQLTAQLPTLISRAAAEEA